MLSFNVNTTYSSKNGTEFQLTHVVSDDCPMILSMIQELAEFEKMASQVLMTVDKLKDDLKRNAFYGIIAKTRDCEGRMVPAGMNIYYLAYSTWEGQFVHMEDLYIRKQFRQMGLGQILINELITICKNTQISRIEWAVLGWNTNAIDLYKKIGGVDMNAAEDWIKYRLSI
uniref:N-acetyltransferase domain-containing protein n=1 Tax=Rhabditophanes sp. KR3021 TaxID=114890 RepID=A0AC35TXX6_9BILA